MILQARLDFYRALKIVFELGLISNQIEVEELNRPWLFYNYLIISSLSLSLASYVINTKIPVQRGSLFNKSISNELLTIEFESSMREFLLFPLFRNSFEVLVKKK